MSWSLSEVKSTVLKATRGAYLPWGLAEEAARAAAWLECHGLPGLDAIAGLIAHNDGRAYAELAPVKSVDGQWTSISGDLCPIISGAYFADCGGEQAVFKNVAYPLLLVPFAAGAGTASNPIAVSWQDMEIVCAGGTFALTNAENPTNPASAGIVAISHCAAPVNMTSSFKTRAAPSASVSQTLARFAHRTYVPATEASRLKGAGAGLSDND